VRVVVIAVELLSVEEPERDQPENEYPESGTAVRETRSPLSAFREREDEALVPVARTVPPVPALTLIA
jgi:hypothetical protein